LGRRIGQGGFGIIHEGVSLNDHAPRAIKFEYQNTNNPQLRDEYWSYKRMQGCGIHPFNTFLLVGIPNVYYFGQEGLHNILCMDLLGPSLENMFDLCWRKFSVKTVCMIAKQMLKRIEDIHRKDLVYRDIKPDNILIGMLPSKLCDPINGIVYLLI
jgi:casein kinase 1